jgi:hypothetical protein
MARRLRGPGDSPLVQLLEDGVAKHSIVKHPLEPIYAGFAAFSDLKASACSFVPMNSNRVVNHEVVERRVVANLKSYKDLGSYLDFGEIALVVLRASPLREFFIMDGQHRIATMERLYARHRDVPLNFHFRVTVCASEKEAHEHLIHFQDCFPADPRAFFQTQAQTRLATAVVDALHHRYPGAFRDRVVHTARAGGGHTADPARPYLNDCIPQQGGQLTLVARRCTAADRPAFASLAVGRPRLRAAARLAAAFRQGCRHGGRPRASRRNERPAEHAAALRSGRARQRAHARHCRLGVCGLLPRLLPRGQAQLGHARTQAA